MISFLRKLRSRLANENGSNLVEYALLLAFICAGVSAALHATGASVSKAYTTISADLTNFLGNSPAAGGTGSGRGASGGKGGGGKGGGGKGGGGKGGGGKGGGGKGGGGKKG